MTRTSVCHLILFLTNKVQSSAGVLDDKNGVKCRKAMDANLEVDTLDNVYGHGC